MKTKSTAPATIDAYLAGFPTEVRAVLEQLRSTIRAAAPAAEETIRYQMPTFSLDGHYLVYFAAHKQHIGFYPAPTGEPAFAKALATYGAGRGTLRFPLGQPLPVPLIRRLVKFRVKVVEAKVAAKRRKAK